MSGVMDGPLKRRDPSPLIEMAKKLGASMAGVARWEELRRAPSYEIQAHLPQYKGVGTRGALPRSHGEDLSCPPLWAGSVLVVGIEHPEGRPSLDWWRQDSPGGTRGNQRLMRICSGLCHWLESMGVRAAHLPYHLENGGIFLKDASVLAGLGCIGMNNLLITPSFGPRVRMRAVLTGLDLEPTGPLDFDPCDGCGMPCRDVCPQGAFDRDVFGEKVLPVERLPARSGHYSRHQCNSQMEEDVRASKLEGDAPVKFCRLCEFACPVGKV